MSLSTSCNNIFYVEETTTNHLSPLLTSLSLSLSYASSLVVPARSQPKPIPTNTCPFAPSGDPNLSKGAFSIAHGAALQQNVVYSPAQLKTGIPENLLRRKLEDSGAGVKRRKKRKRVVSS